MSDNKSHNRNYNLDLLRLLASFFVIVIHVAAYNWYDTSYDTFAFNIYNFFDSIVRSAVPIFVMISGVFFLSEKKQKNIKSIYLKNILKLIIVFLFWSLIYYIYNILVRNHSHDISSFITSFISGPFHFWYIPMIIGLYIISPLLSKIVINSSKKLFKYLFIIFMVGCFIKTISFCSFLPRFDYINLVINKLPIDIICQFYSYFILGYFLYNYDISKNRKKVIYILGIMSVLACTILTFLASKYSNCNFISFYNNFSIFTFFESIALFLFYKNRHFISEKIYSEKVSHLSSCTLGIYLIHVVVMYTLFDFNMINITDFNPILSIPVISVIIFLISLLIVLVIKKIPFIGKYFL